MTAEQMADELRALGVRSDMTLLAHTSLKALGFVCGGPVAVILALEHVVERGTLVMPAHSADLTDPAGWENPPVPQEWWSEIRETMPAFAPDLTPTRGIGIVPECFRKQGGVCRSSHPQFSFAAWGAHAQEITRDHALSFGLGRGSPLMRIYDRDGWVLLLGVGHDRNTSLHLAEHLASRATQRIVRQGGPVVRNGRRTWVEYDDIELEDGDFLRIGEAFEASEGGVRSGRVGQAQAVLLRQRPLVDFARDWIEEHRGPAGA